MYNLEVEALRSRKATFRQVDFQKEEEMMKTFDTIVCYFL